MPHVRALPTIPAFLTIPSIVAGFIAGVVPSLPAFDLPEALGASVDDFEPRIFEGGPGRDDLPYRLFVPSGYDPSQRYPLILFLHGAGERGTDNRRHLSVQTGPLVFVSDEHQALHPSLMVAPQLAGNRNSWLLVHAQLMELLDALQIEFSIDPDRVYLTGLSMGGAGTFGLLFRNPDRFAAAIPMSGWGTFPVDGIKHVPIWNFHGALDQSVEVQQSRLVIDALRSAGANPIYTEYPNAEHVMWTRAYNTPGLVEWLMDQRRGEISTMPPTLAFTSPADASTSAMISREPLVELRGTSAISGTDVTEVWWSNVSSGTSGPASGTSDWSASVPLVDGSNRLILFARASDQTVFTAQGTAILDPLAPLPDAGASSAPDAGLSPTPGPADAGEPSDRVGAAASDVSDADPSDARAQDCACICAHALGTTAPGLSLGGLLILEVIRGPARWRRRRRRARGHEIVEQHEVGP